MTMKLSKDEIIRLSQLNRMAKEIKLNPCQCGAEPIEKFRSDKEYFVECTKCKKRTGYFKYSHEAKAAWNFGGGREVENDG